jgi:hypothetical protein
MADLRNESPEERAARELRNSAGMLNDHRPRQPYGKITTPPLTGTTEKIIDTLLVETAVTHRRSQA